MRVPAIAHISYFSLLLLLPGVVCGQMQRQHKIDSMLRLLPAAGEDTNKAALLFSVSFEYFAIDPATGIRYGEQGLALAKKLEWKKGIALASHSLGANYWAKNDFIKAEDDYLAALKINEEIHNKRGVGQDLHDIGNLYESIYNSPKALEYYGQAAVVDKEAGNKYGAQGCLENIAHVYEARKDYPQALIYEAKAMELAKEINDQRNSTFILKSIGGIYTKQRNYTKALNYEDSALASFRKLGDKEDIAGTLSAIGDLYFQLHDYRAALRYFSEALQLYSSYHNKAAVEYISIYSGQIGNIYLQMAKNTLNRDEQKKLLQKAIGYLEKSVNGSASVSNWSISVGFLKSLSEAQALQGSYAASLETYKKYVQSKDSLYDYRKENEMISHELEYKFGRQKDSLNYLNKLQKGELNTLIREKELAALRSKQQVLYTVVAIIFLCLIASFFFYSNRVQQLRLKNELAQEKARQQLKEAELQNKMSDIMLAALRSQMNPHFIFNCLNSIKLYIMQHNTEAATDYLSKFSKLIRNMLDNSRRSTIPLEEELGSLRLYIDMEVMRFKEKLSCNISMDSGLDAGYIELPPLLIQPYVENAIWHGIMPKEEGGIISIHVSQSLEKDLLYVTIKDNGVGRVRSAELNSKTDAKHKSYGMKVTSERIALLNEKYDSGAEINITDLYDHEGQPAGTQVTIKLPIA